MSWKRLCCVLGLSSCIAAPVYADVDAISVVWHNDLFAGKDGGGYTNGIFFSWYDLYEDNPAESKPPLLTRPVSWLISDEYDSAFSAHTFGQVMSTPKDISKVQPDPNDAPYAGILFLRSSWFVVNDDIADNVSLTLGVLGPASGAEKTQKLIHDITGSTEPKGWDSQLKNEILGQVARGRVWRFAYDDSDRFDLLGMANIDVGNLESSVGTGALIRYGSGLVNSFPSTAMLTGRITNPIAIEGGWYFYLGASAEYVHNSIIINGNTFRSSPSASLRHDQYTVMAGFAFSWDDLTVSLAYADGSSLDKLATSRQTFGAVTLAWRL